MYSLLVIYDFGCSFVGFYAQLKKDDVNQVTSNVDTVNVVRRIFTCIKKTCEPGTCIYGAGKQMMFRSSVELFTNLINVY